MRTGLAAGALAVMASACVGNMQEQPRHDPLDHSDFFDDGRSARDPVPGTVPRSEAAIGSAAMTRGMENGQPVTRFPVPVTAALLAEGETHFDVYCSPCHARTGDGDGMVVRRGYRAPPSFFLPRLVEAPPGHIFDVATRGFGAMPRYDYLLTVRERWAVAAYVKALQLLTTSGTPAGPIPRPATGSAPVPAPAGSEGRR